MSRKYKFHDKKGIYFVSFAVVYWIDVFIRKHYKDIFVEAMQRGIREKGMLVHGWCIMSSHVHLIFSAKNEDPDKLLGNLKAYTSLKIKKAIQEDGDESRKEWMLWMMERAGKKNSNNKKFQFWQQNNKPIELFTYPVFKQKLDYIHLNPVEAGFVSRPEDYSYSSARDYGGEQGVLEDMVLYF